MTPPKGQLHRGQGVLPGEERRRSQRVMVRAPVTLHCNLSNKVISIRAETVAVNDHGAMLLCSRTLDAETKLEIQNDKTRQRVACRVTRTPRETPEGFLIPLEFEKSSPGFRHISFPPSNWKP